MGAKVRIPAEIWRRNATEPLGVFAGSLSLKRAEDYVSINTIKSRRDHTYMGYFHFRKGLMVAGAGKS